MITITTLTNTITPFTRADSWMPTISRMDIRQMMMTAGRLMRPGVGSKGQLTRLAASVDAEHVEQLHHVARPADRNGGGADRIFEHQVPTDDPGEQLAHGGVGVGVRAAGDGDHGGELAVAHAGEGAADGRHHEGEHHRGSGIIGRGDAGEREQARADDRADAQSHQVYRAERAFEGVLAIVGLGFDYFERLGGG